MSWRRLGFISCTHVGSSVGLWPDSWDTADGQTILPSPEQKKIKQYWDHFAAGMVREADTVILMGDLTQGNNRKDFGVGTVVPSLSEQVEAATALLRPVCAGKQVIAVSGSKYHDSLDTSLDMAVCRALGGAFLGALRSLEVKGTGKVINLAHGGASPTMYKATHEDRESMLLDAAIGSGLIRHPIDIVARGHWHYFSHLPLAHRDMLRVPGWQAWYPAKFMMDMLGKKNNYMGAVVMDIGPGRGQSHVHREYLYEPLEIGGNIGEV
jgi:predicted phosphodiesterase